MVCRGHKRVPTRVFCRSTFDARHSLRHVVRTLLQAADLLNEILSASYMTTFLTTLCVWCVRNEPVLMRVAPYAVRSREPLVLARRANLCKAARIAVRCRRRPRR